MFTVIISVLVMILLSLLRVNVVLAILVAGITAGLMTGLNLNDSLQLLIEGMGGQAETALSYILLGVFAMMIGYSGITGVLVSSLLHVLRGKRGILIMTIAAVACLSQNLVPVHIAFVPILIPPMLKIFDEMNVDRRAVASALTFGLKAPYVMIPVGFGFIFHNTISEEMISSGMNVPVQDIWKAMLIPGIGMIVGLFIAVFVTYRKPRQLEKNADKAIDPSSFEDEGAPSFGAKQILTLAAIMGALIVQVSMDSLIFGALSGIILMFVFRVVPFRHGDDMVNDGVKLMGMIAFVMLIASGFANVLKETGVIDEMVENAVAVSGGAGVATAAVMLLVGLIVTMGIGTSFGTVPILAALFVPFCLSVGYSPLATAALIGTAGAMGDAGSPASDSTLGPTSGLNADGRHHHIWDTCVPTFIHYNIPLFFFGLIATIVL
ncbi:TRAP transporter large permease subunit [Salibacterium salarium]|uniref:TRAP transporter large permease subunit n=1 Tax=Salibacterium salarium TaxID=284579 RepID=A0A3R9QJ79_9BACI|nr:Na+/H+ antiporter NhaC family protein [Salibacterium salarium]RSL31651.1 TRAP transporter large permease subunit [Salibacterium salarium]